jgi:protein-tyrosine phosphatase
MVNVLFVCLGNICRSPMAEGVFRKLVADNKLADRIRIDSAGISDWHEGDPPDLRAQQEMKRRGIDITKLRSRPVVAEDFERFEYILAMDAGNYEALWERCPAERRSRLHFCTAFALEIGVRDVPDPYYGGAEGFAQVYELLSGSANGLLAALRQNGLSKGE